MDLVKKFRKKPVVIEAWQFEGCIEEHELPEWTKSALNSWSVDFKGGPISEMSIKTLEGVMQVRKDDWIIKGVNGEVYPCKPDIFEKTYEPVQNTRVKSD